MDQWGQGSNVRFHFLRAVLMSAALAGVVALRWEPIFGPAEAFAREAQAAPAATAAADAAATVIAGRSVACRDIRGVAVRTMKIANLGDVGRAGVINRVPIIAIDPHIIERLPHKLQIFFYQHECAHHVLGHWFQASLNMESDADCWAIRHGRDTEMFSRDDVMSFAPFLAKSGGSPFGHLPGPKRYQHMLKCYDEN